MREGGTASHVVFRLKVLRKIVFGPKGGTTNPSPQPHLVPAISGLELVNAVRTRPGLQPQQVFCFGGFERQGDPPKTVLREILRHHQ